MCLWWLFSSTKAPQCHFVHTQNRIFLSWHQLYGSYTVLRVHLNRKPIFLGNTSLYAHEISKNTDNSTSYGTIIACSLSFFFPKGGSFRQLRRPIKQAISSGWVQTAGAPKSPRYWTRRKWQKAPSPSYQNDSPSKVFMTHVLTLPYRNVTTINFLAFFFSSTFNVNYSLIGHWCVLPSSVFPSCSHIEHQMFCHRCHLPFHIDSPKICSTVKKVVHA